MKFLFDLGGVFFDWDPNYFFKNVFDDDEERKYFLTEVCNDQWNFQQDAGRSIVEAELELIPKFPHYENEIKMYYKNHRKMIRGTFEESIKVLLVFIQGSYARDIRYWALVALSNVITAARKRITPYQADLL